MNFCSVNEKPFAVFDRLARRPPRDNGVILIKCQWDVSVISETLFCHLPFLRLKPHDVTAVTLNCYKEVMATKTVNPL